MDPSLRLHQILPATEVDSQNEAACAALDAHPRRIVRSIFARALVQLSLGVAAGLMTAGLLESLTDGGLMDGKGAVVLPAVSALMILLGLLACIVPARRSLSIQPTEALRDNG